MLEAGAPALILASTSVTRRALLVAAGLEFEAVPPGVDEAPAKRAALASGAAAEAAALTLAGMKARAVRRPGALVIGCDQILVCGSVWYDKPADIAAARVQLQALRGRTHGLATAVIAMRDGVEVWRHAATPLLTMRAFGDAFLDRYLAAAGESVLSSVGAYRLEGLGVHLFEDVQGEHSAILGLPLLPLLGFLRSCGMLRR